MSDEVQRSMGRVEGKLDQVLIMLERHFDDDRKNFSEVREQISAIQKKAWYLNGTIAAAVAFVTAKLGGH